MFEGSSSLFGDQNTPKRDTSLVKATSGDLPSWMEGIVTSGIWATRSFGAVTSSALLQPALAWRRNATTRREPPAGPDHRDRNRKIFGLERIRSVFRMRDSD